MLSVPVIDVSSWQHPGGAPIDFGAVYGSGVRGVMIKATQDVNYVNPFFDQDYEAAKAAGLMVGAYHFCTMVQTPEAEAQWFLDHTVNGKTYELGLSADVEQPFRRIGVDLSSWVTTFLGLIDTPKGTASLYTNRDGLLQVAGAPDGYLLWIALGGAPDPGTYWMVQTGQGEVPGVSGAVDLDTLENIRGHNPPDGGGGVPVPPPAPEPPGPTEGIIYPMNELRQGATGTQVEVLQWRLNAAANANLAVDGDFGPMTDAAVQAYQTGHGLTVDGIVGPQTWGALLA